MSRSPFMFVVSACILAACGTLMLKYGAMGRNQIREFINLWVMGGDCFYSIGFLLWIVALSKLPLVYVYPFTMLTFLMVGAGSVFLLGEKLTPLGLLGWMVILLGVFLIYLGTPASS